MGGIAKIINLIDVLDKKAMDKIAFFCDACKSDFFCVKTVSLFVFKR